MNVKLLRRVQLAILREPKRYAQEVWKKVELKPDVLDNYACNTVGCIAGWACAIELGLVDNIEALNQKTSGFQRSISDRAQKALNLGYHEQNKLFYAGNWPSFFKRFLNDIETSIRGPHWLQAMVAAVRIEVFIWSKGKL